MELQEQRINFRERLDECQNEDSFLETEIPETMTKDGSSN
jgi:hypothetical protein